MDREVVVSEVSFDYFLILLEKYPYIKEIIFTLVFLIIFYISRRVFKKRILRNKSLKKNEKIFITKKINEYSHILFIFSLILLWFAQIQTVFVSLFAVAAALVLATKELIMCITGGILVFLNKSFKNSDRIEIDGMRGYVIEKNFTATRILEIGPEKNSQQTTGSIITIPNSLFLTKSLRNESYFQGYSINSFVFNLVKGIKVEDLESFLLEKAYFICSDYLESSKKYISKFCEKEGFEIPSIEPRVKIILDNKNEISLLLKMPVVNSKIAITEQTLLRDYVKFLDSNSGKIKE